MADTEQNCRNLDHPRQQYSLYLPSKEELQQKLAKCMVVDRVFDKKYASSPLFNWANSYQISSDLAHSSASIVAFIANNAIISTYCNWPDPKP